jgi:hypothetical protein
MASGSLPDPSNEGHSGYIIDQITARIDGWLGQACTSASRPQPRHRHRVRPGPV